MQVFSGLVAAVLVVSSMAEEMGSGSGSGGGYGPFPTGWQGPDCCPCPPAWGGGQFVPAPMQGSFLQTAEKQGVGSGGQAAAGSFPYPMGRGGPMGWNGPDCCPCPPPASPAKWISPHDEGPFGTGRQGFLETSSTPLQMWKANSKVMMEKMEKNEHKLQ